MRRRNSKSWSGELRAWYGPAKSSQVAHGCTISVDFLSVRERRSLAPHRRRQHCIPAISPQSVILSPCHSARETLSHNERSSLPARRRAPSNPPQAFHGATVRLPFQRPIHASILTAAGPATCPSSMPAAQCSPLPRSPPPSPRPAHLPQPSHPPAKPWISWARFPLHRHLQARRFAAVPETHTIRVTL